MTGPRGPLDFDEDASVPPARAPASPPAPPPARPRGASRYTWFLGVVALLLVTVVTLNSIGTEGVETAGPDAGDPLVPFAVPLAGAPPREDEDANVDRDRACAVRGAGVLNVCEQAERGPVVLALFPTEAPRCRGVVRQFARIAPRFGRVRFVAVGSRGARADLRRPGGPANVLLGWDRDGAVASVYGLVGCPQITFARRGGRVEGSTTRPLTDGELARRVRGLL